MTDFLYPFIDSSGVDAGALLDDLARSASAKASESASLCEATVRAHYRLIEEAGREMADRLAGGGRLFAFGNGGSSTDAAALVALMGAHGTQAVAAFSLAADTSIVTALGNDIGVEVVFSRQLIAYGGKDDIAVGFSTSGNSANVLNAFVEASRRGMLTIGFAGYDGGELAGCEALEHCFVVRSESVHRIQEAQAAVSFALWQSVCHHMEAAASS